MRKRIFLLTMVLAVMMSACGSLDEETSEAAQENESEVTASTEKNDLEPDAGTWENDSKSKEDEEEEVMEATLSGSFAVHVMDIIPDYCLDDKNHQYALVIEFQGPPFTIRVGEEIGSQLETNQTYVFTIEPKTVDMHKECLEKLDTASLLWEFYPTIKEFRPATPEEYGLGGPMLVVK